MNTNYTLCSEKNKAKDVKDEHEESEDEKNDSGAAKQPADKKLVTSPTKSATVANKQDTPAAKKATSKAATSATKANRPGPASTKRQVLVNLKRTSAAAIKAATKTANEAK